MLSSRTTTSSPGLAAAYLVAFGRRPRRAGQVAQTGSHETITPATTA